MVVIDKEQARDTISHMRDIDGYASGDCVSRKAVLALLDAIDEIDLDALEDDLK